MSDLPEIQGPFKVRTIEWLTSGWDTFMEHPSRYLLVGLLAVALLTFTYCLLWGPVLLGLAAVGLRRRQEDRIEVADFFEGFRYFVPALLAGILTLFFSLFGLIFLIVPGIVIFSMHLFTFHFIFDEGKDFWDAMDASRKMVARDYFGFALFAVLILLINLLGFAFLFVGAILTVPVTSLAITTAYLECAEGAPALRPAPPSEPVVID
jgi:uncharacterized membrane protein